MAHREHKADAPAHVACAVVTVSDSRTPATDTGGRLVQELLAAHGHAATRYAIVPDEPERVRALVDELTRDAAVEAVLLTGGTGIAPRDTTYEAISGVIEKRLDGFGELFRALSFAEIGAAAMLSRAVAGVYRGKAVFSMPGSTAAVRLAMERLILPELGHIVRELRR